MLAENIGSDLAVKPISLELFPWAVKNTPVSRRQTGENAEKMERRQYKNGIVFVVLRRSFFSNPRLPFGRRNVFSRGLLICHDIRMEEFPWIV